MRNENCIQNIFLPSHALQNQICYELTWFYSYKNWKVDKSPQYHVYLQRKYVSYVSVRKKEDDGHPCELSVMDTEWRRGLKAWI